MIRIPYRFAFKSNRISKTSYHLPGPTVIFKTQSNFQILVKVYRAVKHISVGELIFSFGFQAFDDAIAQLDTLNEESYKVGSSFMHFVILAYKYWLYSPAACAHFYILTVQYSRPAT
jgi:hypothetical protein